MSNQIRLINTVLDRPFFVSPPEFISRKTLLEIKPILDSLSQISKNLALEKYFYENSAIMAYMSLDGQLNAKKLKETAEQMGLDFKDKKSLPEIEGQLRSEMLQSYPGIISKLKSLDLEIDINNPQAWEESVKLIRATGICKQQVDKDLIDENEDPNSDFWSAQSVEEIGKYCQNFRRYMS
jgi:hypothetical protein